jgi:hypothetical protein
MGNFQRSRILIALSLAAFFAYPPSNIRAASDKEFALMLADGYESNFAKAEFQCRFEHVTGLANSQSEARAGKLDSVSTTRYYHWVKKGDSVKFIVSCPPGKKRPDGKLEPAPGCLESRGIASVSHSMRYASRLGIANIWPKDQGPDFVYLSEGTPFGSLASPGPTFFVRLMRDQLSGRVTFKKLQRNDSLLGIETRDVDTDPKRACVCVLSVDPARGFLPVYISMSRNGTIFSETILTEIVQSPDGFWFPKQAVYLSNPRPDGPCEVTTTRVTELRFGSVDRKDLTVEIPTGVQISDFTHSIDWTSSTSRQYHPDDLAEVHSKCLEEGKSRRARDASLRDMGFLDEVPTPTRPWRRWLIIGGIVLIFLLSLAIFSRHRHRRRNAT